MAGISMRCKRMPSMVAPDNHNPANALQHWYTLDQFQSLEPLPSDWVGWQKIPRRRWLSPYLANEGRLRDPAELATMLEQRLVSGGRPAQLAACDGDGVEQRRCFVTPNDWPG